MDVNSIVPGNTVVERMDVNHWVKGGLSGRQQHS